MIINLSYYGLFKPSSPALSAELLNILLVSSYSYRIELHVVAQDNLMRFFIMF